MKPGKARTFQPDNWQISRCYHLENSILMVANGFYRFEKRDVAGRRCRYRL